MGCVERERYHTARPQGCPSPRGPPLGGKSAVAGRNRLDGEVHAQDDAARGGSARPSERLPAGRRAAVPNRRVDHATPSTPTRSGEYRPVLWCRSVTTLSPPFARCARQAAARPAARPRPGFRNRSPPSGRERTDTNVQSTYSRGAGIMPPRIEGESPMSSRKLLVIAVSGGRNGSRDAATDPRGRGRDRRRRVGGRRRLPPGRTHRAPDFPSRGPTVARVILPHRKSRLLAGVAVRDTPLTSSAA